MSEFVSIKNLVKNYGDFCAVDNLSFSVNEGEIFGLLGPNGAGKSTTMNVMSTLSDYTGGKITIGGMDINKEREKVKRIIGVVPQEIAVYPYLTAEENVKFFASLYGLRGRELADAATQALQFTGLLEYAKKKTNKMSGGMKRRLNIACGIAHRPSLIIMDEPTVGVDAQSREHILQSIKKLRDNGATVIYTSHYMNEVEQICDRIAIIDHGRFVACGTEEELVSLVSDYKQLSIKTDFSDEFDKSTFMNEITKLPDVKNGKLVDKTLTLEIKMSCEDYTKVLDCLKANSLPICEISSEPINLDNVFIALTGRELR